MGWAHAQGDLGHAFDGLDQPTQLRWPVDFAVLQEARGEVGDAHRTAAVVTQHGGDDRGVALVIGDAADLVLQYDVGEAFLVVAGQQPGEHRVAVEVRVAPPDQSRLRADQSSHPAVADQAQLQGSFLSVRHR